MERPWAKVAADLFPIEQHNFMIVVDYWSNYFQLEELSRKAATHGIPDEI